MNPSLAARLFPSGTIIYWLLAAILLLALINVEEFREAENLANLLRQSAVLGVLAVGQTVVVVCGLIDLSIGMLVGLIAVLGCDLMAGRQEMIFPAVALALVLGLAVGSLNGVLNNLLRVHPLILTFGMLSVLQGAIFVYTDRSVGLVAPGIAWLANGTVLGVPVAGILLAIVAVAGHLLLTRTRFGLHVYAVGGQEEAARRAGIPVQRVKYLAFVVSGVTAGIAGLLMAGRLGTGYPNAGQGLELDALAAVVLGGSVLGGGRGNVAGSIAAVFILGVVSNVLNLLAVSSFVQMAIKGLIVVGAIIVNQPRRTVAA